LISHLDRSARPIPFPGTTRQDHPLRPGRSIVHQVVIAVGRLSGPRGVRGRRGAGRGRLGAPRGLAYQADTGRAGRAGLGILRERPDREPGRHKAGASTESPEASPQRSAGRGLFIRSLCFRRSAALVNNLRLPCGFAVHKRVCILPDHPQGRRYSYLTVGGWRLRLIVACLLHRRATHAPGSSA
jgi:hypothetical protein